MAKSKRELELDYRYKHHRLDIIGNVVQTFIRVGGWVSVFYFVYEMVFKLAGKFTFADIGIRFLGDIRMSEALAYALATGAGGWALLERKLKGDTIERLSGQVEALEKRLDPGRTSSRLTPRGTTRPEDER